MRKTLDYLASMCMMGNMNTGGEFFFWSFDSSENGVRGVLMFEKTREREG